MQQYTFDDTVFLCLLGQCHQPFIRVVIVGFQHGNHPARSALDIVFDGVGQETLDMDSADGNVNHADTNRVRQGLDHGASEPVCRGQSRIGAAEWGGSLAPFAHFTSPLWVVDGRHQQESRSRTGDVLCLWSCGTFHVRLSALQIQVLGKKFRCKGTQLPRKCLSDMLRIIWELYQL